MKDVSNINFKPYYGKIDIVSGCFPCQAFSYMELVPRLTITCSPAQTQTERCHPEETRLLTIREYARIQTFPDNWEFTGSLTYQYRQIGNAVPVNMAYHVGRCLIKILTKKVNKNDIIQTKNTPKSQVKQLSIPGLNY